MNDGYLECGIPIEDYIEDNNITLHIYLKNDELIVFHNITHDPVFYQGWLNIYHDLFGNPIKSQIRESEFKYLSWYEKPKKGSE